MRGQAALRVAKDVRRRDEFRTERLEPGAHRRHRRPTRWCGMRANARGISVRWRMKYLSTSDGKPAPPRRHPPRTTTRAFVSFFSATTVSATLSRCFSQVPCEQDDIRPDLPDEREDLVIHRAAAGRASQCRRSAPECRNWRSAAQCRSFASPEPCADRAAGRRRSRSPQIRTSGRRSRSTQVSANVRFLG